MCQIYSLYRMKIIKIIVDFKKKKIKGTTNMFSKFDLLLQFLIFPKNSFLIFN